MSTLLSLLERVTVCYATLYRRILKEHWIDKLSLLERLDESALLAIGFPPSLRDAVVKAAIDSDWSEDIKIPRLSELGRKEVKSVNSISVLNQLLQQSFRNNENHMKSEFVLNDLNSQVQCIFTLDLPKDWQKAIGGGKEMVVKSRWFPKGESGKKEAKEDAVDTALSKVREAIRLFK